ncbi:hypothetical protein D3C77_716710 [compost metagenome]
MAEYTGSTPTPMPALMASVMASAVFTWKGVWLTLTISWPSGPSNSHLSRDITLFTRRRQRCFERSEGRRGAPCLSM